MSYSSTTASNARCTGHLGEDDTGLVSGLFTLAIRAVKLKGLIGDADRHSVGLAKSHLACVIQLRLCQSGLKPV